MADDKEWPLRCWWCGRRMKEVLGGPDGYYIAWDWEICGPCWMEMHDD
jgi:hypothetical protein